MLLAAGVVDSFGLSLGWTAFTLLAVMRGGLPLAGLYNSAMFLGIVLSAPVTGWLARRLNGRAILRCTGAVELVLRVATMAALLAGTAPTLVAVGIVIMNVVAWAAYAGMRAEVVAVESGTRSLTRYAMAIAAIEALGAAVAATLPLGSADRVNVAAVVAVTAVYGASLLPQFACARRAQVQRGRQPPPGGLMGGTALRAALTAQRLRRRRDPGLPRPRTARALVGGGVLMLVASGPASLGVALAAELDGHLAVVGCAITFTAGCLLAPVVAQQLDRLRLPTRVAWPMLGVGMLAGWVIAPWQIAGLLTAQFLSGLSMTAFTGEMDARVAERAEPGRVTSLLAWAAASRATGSAVAVRVIPLLVAAQSIGLLSFAAIAVLVAGALMLRAAPALTGQRVRPPSPSGHLRSEWSPTADHSLRK